MRIDRLRLREVKRHAELDLEFAPGLTVIRGPNESGKSTIQRALEMVLFRRATSTAQELDGVRRWGAQGPPTVAVDFTDEGVRGRLVKKFAGASGTVELTTEEGVERDPAAIDHVIAALTGLPSEKFFQATASVRHHDLTNLRQDEGTLRDRLQQSMSGATRGTYAAKRKLEEAIRRYRSEGPKNPGLLKLARSEVERREAEVAQGEDALRRLEADRRALAQARDARAAVEAELAEQEQAVVASERAVALQQRAADAQRRYATYKKAAELREEIGELEASHPSATPLADLRATVERMRGLEYRLSEIRAELAAEPDLPRYEMALPEPRWRGWAVAAVSSVVAALIVGGLGLAIEQPLPGLVGAGVLVAIAALCAIVAQRRRGQLADIQLQKELREHEIARRVRGRSERGYELRDTERERNEALAALGLPDLRTAEQLLSGETAHVARIDELRAEYRGLLADSEPEQDVAELRDAAAAEADECRHALAGMGDIGAEPEKSLATHRAAVERLRSEREQALATELQAEGRLDANRVDAELVAAASEALAAASEQLHHAERRLRIYEQTLAALRAAEVATMKKAARFLEQSMARDIARITDGRYRRLRVDEANLRFSVYSVERGEWTEATELSQGTLDQLYLCARLGIVRQVTQPASPPLIFDDPFVTFDEQRARRALEVLRETAAELQVIYLTSSDRYDDLADRVIVLEGPTGRDAIDGDAATPGPAGRRQAARVGAPAG